VTRISAWTVPLGGVDVPVTAPAGWRTTLAAPPIRPALADLEAAIAEALARPLGTLPLGEIVADKATRATAAGRRPTAVIGVTDATRDCPDDRFLPPLLAEIEAGGIAPEDITIVVATGLHRPSSDEEKRRKVGDSIVDRYRIVDHDARDPATIADLGRTVAGFPIAIDRLALEADLLVSTGVVEPHQYAGYSGGAKTVAIGLAGEPTIDATHSIAMVDDPGVRLGRLDGNPFHEAVVEIGRRVGLDFVVNVVVDPDERPLAVAAGEPEAVHHHLAGVAAGAFIVEIPRQADVAIAGVGAPKDANLYQATRAVTYLHYTPTPAVRPGGVYVLPATIPEGAGNGVGERRFFEALRDATSLEELVDRLRRDGSRAGEQRSYLVARVLQETTIIVVGACHPEVPEACGMRTAPTLDAGLALAAELASATHPAAERDRALELLVVPNAIRTLPIVTPPTIEDGRR
jgi:nickel-dependent lactate racemase